MPSGHRAVHEQLRLRVQGVNLKIAAVRRGGADEPIVFLHGFGTSKEDYTDITQRHDFAGRSFLTYDAPGCGASECADLGAIDVPFLVDTARAVLDRAGIGRYHVVGHSLGGLTALLLAHREPGRVLSFVNIKGTLAPEDCAGIRHVLSHQEPGDAFLRFAESLRLAPGYSGGLYAANLPHKVRRGAVDSIFRSVIELADHGDLLNKFIALPIPKMYLYGEECASLSYLPLLDAHGVELAEIPHSGHLPMYSNPVATWKRIAVFYAGDLSQRIPAARRW
ncbi:pimeloyl-ACP methyl ester carboxylesterase [Lentzea atacamensis]|uniref:Pimeloyl-ACP methyl ester carboxylesterase n=1 Tax=Lentzea atacamensis TaxID=531938 RepID=A0ABX9EIY3_9PSEU|nr:pimeloyl-ACP methyl ester carboxylesterase [Lentzea atacamensis]